MDVDGDDVATDEENGDEEEEEEPNSMEVDGEGPSNSQRKKKPKLKPRKSQMNVENLDADEVDATSKDMEDAEKLRVGIKLHVDGMTFIREINDASDTVAELLGSKKRPEVIEAINFFMCARTHGMTKAQVCARPASFYAYFDLTCIRWVSRKCCILFGRKRLKTQTKRYALPLSTATVLSTWIHLSARRAGKQLNA